jgi:Xaa-Pro aminopeptidase
LRDMLAGIVAEERPGRVALNFSPKDPTSDGLSHTGYLLVREALERADFRGEILSSQNLMKIVRAGKSPEEIEGIRHAVLCAMDVFEAARPSMRKGMSGMDIQRLFQEIADGKGYGYSWSKFGNPFNSIGTRTSYLCVRPAHDVFIEPGDVVNVDFGLLVNGFASDNQRTFYALRAGEDRPPDEVLDAFDTLGEVNRALASGMLPGVRSGDILARANETLVRRGYPERSGGFGHEIGIFAHDGAISPGSAACEPDIDTTFITGYTATLEPAIVTRYGRVCREEVVTVTQDGGRFLSVPQDAVWLIP